MGKPPALTNIKITLDHFFKFQLREFLGICGYRVESEHEMLHFPKKLDALVIGEGSAAASDFKIFNYFRRYNLISYKSFNDSLRVRDIYALSLYYHLYLQEQADSNYGNTTITLICSRTPKKFIRTYKDLFTEVQRGHFVGNYAMYQIHIINIERIDISGPDGIFLSEFCRETGRISGEAEIQSACYSQEIIDKLLSGYKMRMGLFEEMEGDNMGAVADVTELVRPKLEQAWKEGELAGQQLGRQEGIQEGIQKGMQKGVKQTAKKLKEAGVASAIICKTTGLTQEEIDKL